MKITILGCGSSGGTPLISGEWGKCDPNNPRNRRTRCSAALTIGEQTWLIDVSPDVHFQCQRASITSIMGILCTHYHFDHSGGLGDLRHFAKRQGYSLPFYSNQETLDVLRHCYDHAFEGSMNPHYKPFLKAILVTDPFYINHIPVIPFAQDHHYLRSVGFRFPTWAYSTDVWELDDKALQTLQGVDLWIIDCTDTKPSLTHAHLDKVLGWAAQIAAKRVVLTHLSINMDHDTLLRQLPPHITPAYDGLVLEVADSPSS